jgi:hypothetical protein
LDLTIISIYSEFDLAKTAILLENYYQALSNNSTFRKMVVHNFICQIGTDLRLKKPQKVFHSLPLPKWTLDKNFFIG